MIQNPILQHNILKKYYYSRLGLIIVISACNHDMKFYSLADFCFFLLDSIQVVPGELTIVTGVPNSGKSEWIDALLCNLNYSVGWKFALCSMENRVGTYKSVSHHIKLG